MSVSILMGLVFGFLALTILYDLQIRKAEGDYSLRILWMALVNPAFWTMILRAGLWRVAGSLCLVADLLTLVWILYGEDIR